MPELVDVERVIVDHLLTRQVPPACVRCGTVLLRIDEVSVDLIKPEDKPTDLESWDEEALAGPRLPGQYRGGVALLCTAHTQRHEGEDKGQGAGTQPLSPPAGP